MSEDSELIKKYFAHGGSHLVSCQNRAYSLAGTLANPNTSLYV
jgi:hypothetical protein